MLHDTIDSTEHAFERVEINNIDQGLKLLPSGRVAYFMLTKEQLDIFMHINPGMTQDIHIQTPRFRPVPLHTHLHVKNRALVEPLALALTAIKKETGEADKKVGP